MNLKVISKIATAICMGIMLATVTPTDALGQRAKTPRRYSPRSAPMTNPTDKPQQSDIGTNEWLLQERIIFIAGEIYSEMSVDVISQLLHLDAQDPGKDIYLYINSEGGEVTAGFAIYDVMRSLRSDVVTVAVGEASSMASFLLAAGTKGKRFVLPHARIMIHQPLGGSGGQASDIAIQAREILYLKNQLNQMLAAMTGQPLKRIETDTDRDFFMSPQEAQVYGLVDRVVKRLPSASNPDGK